MDRPKLIGDIVTHWHKYGERRKTVCFAVNVSHSVHLTDEFIKSGVKAEHIDGGTPKPERDATLTRLASGEIELVSNCMVLTEGWDMPEVGCCILARPTKKMGLYRQMIGRVLRPAEGKPDAIILDHTGAVFRHGFAEDHVEWVLDPERRSSSPTHDERGEPGSKSRLLECTQCSAIRCSVIAVCPEAWHEASHIRIAELVHFPVNHANILPTQCFGGLTRYTIDEEPSLRTMRRLALVSLSGPVAESLFTGEPIRQVLARNAHDCNRARSAVAIITGDASMAALRAPARRVRALVERHWASIEALAQALQLRKSMSGAEVARVIYLTERQQAATKGSTTT